MLRNANYLITITGSSKNAAQLRRGFTSGSDKKPIKLQSPIYREEGDPVLFRLDKKSYIPSPELNPREDPSTIPSKEGYAPSQVKEELQKLSESEIEKLVHYAKHEKKVGILEPFEQTFKRLITFCQQRPYLGLRSIDKSFTPQISTNALIFPTSSIIGKVQIFDDSSVWYNCIIKAHSNSIKIGANTNIQDGTVIVESPHELGLDHDGSTIIGHYVTVGHNCVIHAATIEDRCLIGMKSILEDNSYMEENSMLGAGSVLKSGSRVKKGELWVGNPAKFVRNLTGLEILSIEKSSEHYVLLAKNHLLYLPKTRGRLNPLTLSNINV